MEKKKKRRNRKVVRFRGNINIGIVFFGAIFFYMIIYIYMYFTSVHISGYEVIAGSLATDKQFTGLALRTEEIMYADKTGTIDYYANEGARVSGDSLIYTIDQDGRMSEYLKENSKEADLSDENYASLKSDISLFSGDYSPAGFAETYDFHSSANGTIMELLNQSLMSEVEEAALIESSTFSQGYSAKSGIVSYSIDGYETVSAEAVTAEMFDQGNYTSNSLRSVTAINAGDPVYKLITDENWELVVPVSKEQLEEISKEEVYDTELKQYVMKDRTVVEVKFLKDQSEVWGYLSTLNINGQDYLKLKFNTAMVRYVSDRYLDIQFLIEDTSGLKIPNSSITEKDFFVIPQECYMDKSDKSAENGFMVETFDEDGNATVVTQRPTLYALIDGMYYIDPMEADFESGELYIKEGDRIRYPDSQEVFQVKKTASLEGVYCINQGFTKFRKIEILYSNEEYSIIQEGTSLGLTLYDRIVLDSEAVDEDQVIY